MMSALIQEFRITLIDELERKSGLAKQPQETNSEYVKRIQFLKGVQFVEDAAKAIATELCKWL